jgi:putative addiction module component (TIGR02574 family)
MEQGRLMKYDVSEILKEALKLPLEARAAIAGSLLDSLDETIDEDAEIAWEAEILLRLRKIDDGKVKLVPWVEARRLVTG